MAAALLGEETIGGEAARLLADPHELLAPSHWKAELVNVIWKAVRLKALSPDRVEEALDRADALPITAVDLGELWRGGVARAIAADHPAYDTLFVELAARRGALVASYDRQLRLKFPDHVRLPGDLVGGPG